MTNKKNAWFPKELKECKVKQQDAIFHLSDGREFKRMVISIVGKNVGCGHSH